MGPNWIQSLVLNTCAFFTYSFLYPTFSVSDTTLFLYLCNLCSNCTALSRKPCHGHIVGKNMGSSVAASNVSQRPHPSPPSQLRLIRSVSNPQDHFSHSFTQQFRLIRPHNVGVEFIKNQNPIVDIVDSTTCTGLNLTTHIFLATDLRRDHQRDLAKEIPRRPLFRHKLMILLES